MKLLPILFVCVPLVAHAEWGDVEREFAQDKPLAEVAAPLPAYPQDANLLPFTVSSATRNTYFVDTGSISVGADNVVRYTVVIEAAGGAKTVSFEGMRCESGERRLYAYGQPDGTWTKARNANWDNIKLRSLLSYQKALYEDVFCRDGLRVRDSKEAAQNLRRAAR